MYTYIHIYRHVQQAFGTPYVHEPFKTQLFTARWVRRLILDPACAWPSHTYVNIYIYTIYTCLYIFILYTYACVSVFVYWAVF